MSELQKLNGKWANEKQKSVIGGGREFTKLALAKSHGKMRKRAIKERNGRK